MIQSFETKFLGLFPRFNIYIMYSYLKLLQHIYIYNFVFAFAAGGNLAKKCSNQITQQTNEVKESAHQYIHIFNHPQPICQGKIELENAFDVTSTLWKQLDESKPSMSTVPTYLKHQLFDDVAPSAEEKKSIHMEMGNCVYFYRTQKSKLCTLTGRLQSKNDYEKQKEKETLTNQPAKKIQTK